MLEIRPNCECCDTDLPAKSAEAVICSFECTFCLTCAQHILQMICPNCSGNLVQRPVRPEALLAVAPVSTKRLLKNQGCIPKNA